MTHRAYDVVCVGAQLPTLLAGALLAKRGFRDAVLWNVGEAKGAGMGDLGAGEWRNYVCVEAGAIGTPVTLQPGETFVGGQTFAAGGGAAAPKEEL